MEFTAIIAEFNPLTKGHEHLINEAKRLYPTSNILVIMSGSFVQRGTPSILPKHIRAQQAIISGVDAVLELPVIYSLSSAEDFAFGAISILNTIPGVKRIIFGSECGDINILKERAKALKYETKELKTQIKTSLKQGNSYASSVIMNDSVLSSPNNLLGTMYINALNKLNSHIEAVTIKRENNYNSDSLNSTFPSASAIRAKLEKGDKLDLLNLVSSHIANDLIKAKPIKYNELFNLISYKILTSSKEDIKNINGVSEGLENKIIAENNSSTSYSEFIELITSKRYFKNKIQRICSNILLNITKQDVQEIKNEPYIKLLCVNQNDKNAILKELSLASCPLITKLKDYNKLSLTQQKLIKKDLLADDIHSLLLGTNKQQDFKNRI